MESNHGWSTRIDGRKGDQARLVHRSLRDILVPHFVVACFQFLIAGSWFVGQPLAQALQKKRIERALLPFSLGPVGSGSPVLT